VTLNVAPGERIGVVGPNGAGKTSLLKVISGAWIPSNGTRFTSGKVAALLGDPGFGLDLELSGLTNIGSMLTFQGIGKAQSAQLIHKIAETSGLKDAIHRPCYTYSAGMLTRLKVSALLFRDADIWVVDEGIATADDEFNLEVRSSLFEKLTSTTLILATHSELLINSICTRVIVMSEGRIQFDGQPQEGLAHRRSFVSSKQIIQETLTGTDFR
jgi:ABC-type polysaccharide/polyol phosphate transport system ATPase subunit